MILIPSNSFIVILVGDACMRVKTWSWSWCLSYCVSCSSHTRSEETVSNGSLSLIIHCSNVLLQDVWVVCLCQHNIVLNTCIYQSEHCSSSVLTNHITACVACSICRQRRRKMIFTPYHDEDSNNHQVRLCRGGKEEYPSCRCFIIIRIIIGGHQKCTLVRIRYTL